MLATLLSTVLSGETASLTRRAKITVIYFALIGLLVVLGASFALLAGYAAAAQRFGPVEAAIGFCVAFLAIAICLYLAYRIYLAREKKKAKARRAADFSMVGISAAMAAAPLLMRGNVLMKLGVPAVALLAYGIYRENAKPKSGRGSGRLDEPDL